MDREKEKESERRQREANIDNFTGTVQHSMAQHLTSSQIAWISEVAAFCSLVPPHIIGILATLRSFQGENKTLKSNQSCQLIVRMEKCHPASVFIHAPKHVTVSQRGGRYHYGRGGAGLQNIYN